MINAYLSHFQVKSISNKEKNSVISKAKIIELSKKNNEKIKIKG